MRNFFGICLEHDGLKTDERCDGHRFLLRRVDAEFKKSIDERLNAAKELSGRASLPVVLVTLKGLCMIYVVAVICSIIENYGQKTVAQLFGVRPWFFIAAIFCAALWIGLRIYENRRAKRIVASGAVDRFTGDFLKLEEEAERQLGIPEDYQRVDILVYNYKLKNGKEKREPYANCEMKLFAENGCLCLADMNDLYAIPMEGFCGFTLGEKKIGFFGWNKDEEYNEGKYKQFNIKTAGENMFSARCCSLSYSDPFGEFELLFPEYELESFKKLVDLPVKS